VLIAGLIVYFAIRYRRSVRPNPPPKTHMVRSIEVLWTVVPLVIVLGFFVWGGRLFLDVLAAGPDDAYEIYVVGKQWMWKFEHPEGRREINTLHIPVGKPVRLIQISQDVIHSFFIPAFRVKHDVLPLSYNIFSFTATKEGQYHIFCSQYCGTKHS